jgi:nicotinamidase-related amidase
VYRAERAGRLDSGAELSTALLIIDVQRALCTGDEEVFGIGAVIDRINALSCRARASCMPVIFVQHEEDEGPFRSGTQGWELADGLVAVKGDLRVRKTTPNSFHRTELQKLLHERGVQRLVICGLQTEYCVDTTLRQALSLGYRVVLASDAHSTVDGVLMAAQIIAHHNHTFRNMNSFGPVIEVKPTAEVAFDA